MDKKEEKDVDLYEELKKTLDSEKDQKEEESDGASSEKPKEEVIIPKEEDNKEDGEMSEEEISKLSPRAQKRIRDLADQVKKLAEKPAEEKPQEEPQEKKPKEDVEFNTVEELLNSIEDEPSRKLLEIFYKTQKKEISSTLSPIEKANNEAKFDSEFESYAKKIDGLKDHKDDLKKTFMRNPNQPIKALISEIVMDLQMNKVKPLEKTPSMANRSGEPDLDSLDKDQLYDRLESMKGR